MHPVEEIAQSLDLGPDEWEPVGWEMGKVTHLALSRAEVLGPMREDHAFPGRLVLVTAMTPTPRGEGKTTTSIGLADGLCSLGVRSMACLREPSLGPSLGMKGGGTGGGRASLEPSDRINLHFTGDLHAITAANNLLAAVVDSALHFRTTEMWDARDVTFYRALDMDDRALRSILVGLGGEAGGVPRETGFVITAASEVMAALALASGLDDLRDRLGRIVVAFGRKGHPVTAKDLGAHEAMTALLADAIRPNLVRTAEGTPAFVHAGPFANIAHGTSSILATRFALTKADVVVTEAGFGSDLGAEKFADLVCSVGGFAPETVVVVATVRALAYHGGLSLSEDEEDPAAALAAMERGFANLDAHLRIVTHLGVPVVVAVNRFSQDRDEEIEHLTQHVERLGVPWAVSDAFARGAEGGAALARVVMRALGERPPTVPARPVRRFYPEGAPLRQALESVARDVYGAEGIHLEPAAERSLRRLEKAGYGSLPVCVAKTQASLTDDPHVRCISDRPWRLTVRDIRLSAGAGFAVAITGDILTMPGLPREPQALRIGVRPDGTVVGIR